MLTNLCQWPLSCTQRSKGSTPPHSRPNQDLSQSWRTQSSRTVTSLLIVLWPLLKYPNNLHEIFPMSSSLLLSLRRWDLSDRCCQAPSLCRSTRDLPLFPQRKDGLAGGGGGWEEVCSADQITCERKKQIFHHLWRRNHKICMQTLKSCLLQLAVKSTVLN